MFLRQKLIRRKKANCKMLVEGAGDQQQSMITVEKLDILYGKFVPKKEVVEDKEQLLERGVS